MIKLKDLLKENIKRKIPNILYHATFGPLMDEIEMEGLLPSGEKLMHNFSGIIQGVYLAQTAEQAGSFIETSENTDIPKDWFGQIVIISIDTTKLDKTLFDIDPNVNFEDENYDTFVYKGTIPPSTFIEINNYNI